MKFEIIKTPWEYQIILSKTKLVGAMNKQKLTRVCEALNKELTIPSEKYIYILLEEIAEIINRYMERTPDTNEINKFIERVAPIIQ